MDIFVHHGDEAEDLRIFFSHPVSIPYLFILRLRMRPDNLKHLLFPLLPVFTWKTKPTATVRQKNMGLLHLG
jgi:hypothetical protein